MKRGKATKAAICVSVLLTATTLLFLQLTGGRRVTASDSDQEVSEGIVSSRVIAEREPVELIEQRDDHRRVWEIAREVETTHPDGARTVDTVRSYIHEKGSGLCYRDASGSLVPAVPEWRETPEGFVIDRCSYSLCVGKTLGSWVTYSIDGRRVFLARPASLPQTEKLAPTSAFLTRKYKGSCRQTPPPHCGSQMPLAEESTLSWWRRKTGSTRI
jgi:hypothetical protein